MNINGRDYTNFKNVRVKGDRDGATAGAVNFITASGQESSLSVNTTYQDSSYGWTLPAKSGLIGVSGTFTVNLPAITAGSYIETAVVVSGLRAEDGFNAFVMTNAYETVVSTNRGFAMLGSARPSATGIDMVFLNPTATATAYNNIVIGYTAFR